MDTVTAVRLVNTENGIRGFRTEVEYMGRIRKFLVTFKLDVIPT